MVSIRRRRHTRKTLKRKSKYHRRSHHKRMKHKRSHRRHSNRRHSKRRRRQRGGKNSTWFTMDNRYRPIGGLEDSVKYNGKKIYNNIVGNYHGTNPATSSQPIGKPLSINSLKFGVGSATDASRIYSNADKQSALYTQ